MKRLLAALALVLVVGCGGEPEPLPPLNTYEVRNSDGVVCIEAREFVHEGGSQGHGDHYDFYEYGWGKGQPVAVIMIDKATSIRKVQKCVDLDSTA